MVMTDAGFQGLPTELPAIAELVALPRWVVWKYVWNKESQKWTKPPFIPGAGFRASINKPAHWDTYERAARVARERNFDGVGFVLTDDDDLFGIDLDNCIETNDVIADWAKEVVDLGETYTEISPSGRGLRMLARGDIESIRAEKVGVEVYGAGRYVTITGDRLPGAPDTIQRAPRTIQLLEGRAAAAREARPATPSSPPPAAVSGQRYDDDVPLEELEELTTHIPAACGYHEWIQVGMALHAETGGSGAGLEIFDRWSATGGTAYAGRREIEAKWRSFKRDGVRRGTLAKLAQDHGANLSEIALRHRTPKHAPDDGFDPDGMTIGGSDKVEPTPAPTPPSEPIAYPDGLVGDIARWIVSTARKPQPAIAIGAALTVVGTAAGRQIMGPTGTGTALYALGLAPTGQGKDAPLQRCRRILSAAGMGHHLGPDEFMSFSAVVNTMKRNALILCAMDEFGDFLRRVYDRKGSPHARAIPKVLRSFWSANWGIATTPEWADRESITLHAPHLSLFAVATHQQFYDALEGGAASDGTLNRFLLLEGDRAPPDVEPEVDPAHVPRRLSDALWQIFVATGELAAGYRGDGTTNPVDHDGRVIRLAWASSEAREAWQAFRREMEGRALADAEEAELVVRAAEIAVRIATIVAVGRSDSAVGLQDVRTGIDLARRSTEAMVTGAQDYMATNEQEANWQKVVRYLKANGGAASNRRVQRYMRHMRARDLSDLRDAMDSAGVIEVRTGEAPAKGGKTPVWWRLL